ncbi:hypothetical protein HOY82DRAFT_152597 [Tuber indicum]|nr:hypothetical protein HOY82DRAFT_152597 [Tuber indicum]
MMGVSRRARKRTNRGYSKDKDKILVKKQNTKHKKQAEGAHRGSKSFVRSFVPSISHLLSSVPRASSPSLRRFSSPLGLRSVNYFFLYISVSSFSHVRIACEVSRQLGRNGRAFWLFFVCKGRLLFFSLSYLFPTLFPSFASDSSFLLYSLYDTPLAFFFYKF